MIFVTFSVSSFLDIFEPVCQFVPINLWKGGTDFVGTFTGR